MVSPKTSENMPKSAIEWIYLGIVLLGTAVILVLRSYGAYPAVMPDEFFHNKFSRLMALADVEIPGYFYYAVYSTTSLWGDNFIEGARILNAIFYSLGGLFIYITAREFLPKWMSMCIMIASLAMPTNMYVSHFMPEAMYFFLFWVLQYVVLIKYQRSKFTAVWIGVLLGALALVKPHAIFLLPVYAGFMVICRGFTKIAIFDTFQYLLAFTVTRLGAGFVLAGTNGISFFGRSYTEHAERATADVFVIFDSILSVLLNISGHVVVLCYIFGIGVLYLVSSLKNSELVGSNKIHWLLFLHLIVLIPIISVFTSSVALFEGDVDNRLHMRYYSFALPYFFLIVGMHSTKLPFDTTKLSNVLLGIFVGMMAFALMYYNSVNKFFYPFAIGIVDVPELFLLTQNRVFIYIVGVLSVLSVSFVFKSTRISHILFSCLLVPAFVVGTWSGFQKVGEARFEAQDLHLAGQLMRQTLPVSAQDSLLVVGYRINRVYAAMMYAESKNVRYEQVSAGASFDMSLIKEDTKYILVLDSLDLTSIADTVWKQEFARLYRLKD